MSTISEVLAAAEKPKKVPTAEQVAIINAACNTYDSLLINALAGAAKTTTLEMICYAMPVQPILSLAFNKRIADEMGKKLPGHVKCQTLNSAGHRVWAAAASGKIILNVKKSYEILKAKVDNLPRKQRSEAYEVFSDTLKLVGKAKLAGYIPDGKYPQARRLVSSEAFWTHYQDEEVDSDLVNETLTESIRQAYLGHIDFDDQIYMPTLFAGSFPRFPLVMCDEVQDLSAINHAMLEKLVTQRLIAVGDPYQSIYRFRGAQSSGMAALKQKFDMREMNLSVSFRCPKAVIQRAQSRAPHMRWPDWAADGLVQELGHWDANSIADNAAIICRNNAPLISLAFKLLRRGRGVKMVGFDIGPNLLRTLKKLGDDRLTQEEVGVAINKWEAEKLALKKGSEATTRDKAECLRVFATFGATLGEAIAYADSLFKESGPIQLLSGHKSKGLEWDTVYHLDPWRIPSAYAVDDEDLEQEDNIRYVIETRPKKHLYLINSKDFERGEEDVI